MLSADERELAAQRAIQARASLWTLLALASVIFALNFFLGIVAAILAQLARRAAGRGELGSAAESLRWARLLTLIGIGLFALAAGICALLVVASQRA